MGVKRWITSICLTGLISVNLLLGVYPGYAQAACAPTKLAANSKAQVATSSLKTFPYPSDFLKKSADRTSPVLRYLGVGNVVDVVEGPTCAGGSNWWKVKLTGLTGYIAETNGKDTVLVPFTGDAPAPLSSSVVTSLDCIAPNSAPEIVVTDEPVTPVPVPTKVATASAAGTAGADNATAQAPAPQIAPTATLDPATVLTRVVYASADGTLLISDNGANGRSVTRFDPAPLSMDLSPDGSAVLVVTYNGLYWVDATTGSVLLVADAQKFGMSENAWLDKVAWTPNGRAAAVEITKLGYGLTTYQLWEVPLDGSYAPYEVDSGAQGVNGIQRSPSGQHLLSLSSNAIALFPRKASEDTFELLRFVSKMSEGDFSIATLPTLSWDATEHGFYTFIPVSNQAPPDDLVGGHLWYVPLNGPLRDLGKPPKVTLLDYVIPSNDGKTILVGRGTVWVFRDAKTGTVLQSLPAGSVPFDWTPDYKGVVYRNQKLDASYLGIDGSTTSPYVPTLSNLADIKWLQNGTSVFSAVGTDKKLSLSIQLPGKDPAFLGI